jgi:hypothetical protein
VTVPTVEERRQAIAVARQFASDAATSADIRLLALTLLAAQEAFINRLAPVYAAAQALVRDDGSQDAKAWFAFKDVVLRCRAYDSRTIEPHEPQTGAGR